MGERNPVIRQPDLQPASIEVFSARSDSRASAMRHVMEIIIREVVLGDILAMRPTFTRDGDGYTVCTMHIKVIR